MDYEQKYEKALKVASQWHKDGIGDVKKVVECIFPELKESEDEKIRKGLIKGLSAMRDIHNHQTFSDDAINIDDAIAWLEKQKPSDEALQYLKDNHSPSDISDFQAAMNVAVAKAFDAGKESVEKHNFVWNEEDEANMNAVWKACGQVYGTKYQSILGDWLKSLKPQQNQYDKGFNDGYSASNYNRWKPTEEQMEIIDMILTNESMDDNVARIMRELKEQLLKL